VPALDVAAVALAALLGIFAYVLFSRTWIAAARANTPGFFSPLWDGLAGAEAAIYNLIRPALDAAVAPLTGAFNALTASLHRLVQNPLAFARNVFRALDRLANQTVPFVLDTARRWAEEARLLAEAFASDLVVALRADLDRLAARLEAELQGLGPLLAGYVEQVYARIVDYVQRLSEAILERVEAVWDQLRAFAVLLVQAEAETARRAEQEVTREAGQAINEAEGRLVAEIRAVEYEAGQLARQFESDLARARVELGAEVEHVEQVVEAEVRRLLSSGPWAAVVAAYDVGEAAVKSDVQTLVTLGLAEVRRGLADAGVIRAKYGPVVRARIEELKARL
jgi:hypothetical protein